MPNTVNRQPSPRVHEVTELARLAREVRKKVIAMAARSGHGYVQQGLGAADIFTALYFSELRLDVADASWRDRDRLILSTAHNSALFHATLAQRGLIAEADLASYRVDGSPLEINCSERLGPLVEATCGSLGQGLSVAVGMALGARRRQSDARVYVILGDGEMQEGQVWEAAMAAGHFGLGNLCLFVDLNEMQVGGHTDNVMNMAPVGAKWQSFGWRVEEIDGNSLPQVLASLEAARNELSRPTCIVARTLLGKGSSTLEGIRSHTIKMPRAIADKVLAELEQQR